MLHRAVNPGVGDRFHPEIATRRMVYAMTHPSFDEEPDFNAPIEPVRPGRSRPWIAAISIILIVVIVITGLAGFGLPLIWHPEVTVTFESPAPASTAAT